MKKAVKGLSAGFISASIYYYFTNENAEYNFQRTTSILFGRVASLNLPSFARSSVYNFYGKVFGVNFDEIDGELESFPSISAFFTRKLKPGSREWANQGIVK